MVFKKQKLKQEEIKKLEEEIKEKMEKAKEEVSELEEEENTSEDKWKVGSIAIQTEPVIILGNKTYTIYESLAETLNKLDELLHRTEED